MDDLASAPRLTARLRVGTSGYHYPEWRGLWYLEGLPRGRWFEHYATLFDTVEVNSTFYGGPAERTFDAWRERAPARFLYALKVSREITHRRRLAGADAELDEMVARAGRLEGHLGPLLVQLPPRWPAAPGRLDAFLARGRERAPGLRWAVELREESWLCDEVFAVLRDHAAALVLHDRLAGCWECGGAAAGVKAILTAPWTYLRFHGRAYAGSYGAGRLVAEAERIAAWLTAGVDVYAYFNNTKDGSAVADALELRGAVLARFGSRPDSLNVR